MIDVGKSIFPICFLGKFKKAISDFSMRTTDGLESKKYVPCQKGIEFY